MLAAWAGTPCPAWSAIRKTFVVDISEADESSRSHQSPRKLWMLIYLVQIQVYMIYQQGHCNYLQCLLNSCNGSTLSYAFYATGQPRIFWSWWVLHEESAQPVHAQQRDSQPWTAVAARPCGQHPSAAAEHAKDQPPSWPAHHTADSNWIGNLSCLQPSANYL